jgi:hypothetical protein
MTAGQKDDRVFIDVMVAIFREANDIDNIFFSFFKSAHLTK